MSAVQLGELDANSGRVAVLNEGGGAKIIASNQCGEFPFKLTKMIDPRVDVDSVADYDKNVIAYVGARNWNKFKYNKDYTNPTQLKFSNIKTPGAGYLIDMKWWLEYTVKIELKDFPVLNKDKENPETATDESGIFLGDDIMCFRPFPLHQCTDNIHLRINNRDLVSYPTQTLNQRMEYWQQDRFKDSTCFCPHRKPNVQTTYEYVDGKNKGRWPFMDLGSSYDGDYGNECVIDEEKVSISAMKVEGIKGNNYDGTGSPKKLWYFAASKGTQTIQFTMREPVMCEPLDYYSSRTGSRSMNNVTSIDLEYNFNNLRNMILFNHAKLLEAAEKRGITEPATAWGNAYTSESKDWWSDIIEKKLDSILNVEIENAHLELNIATPQVPPSMPFVTEYLEYRRYETTTDKEIPQTEFINNKSKIYELESDIYSLSYMPNSIYVWVAPNDTKIYGTSYRCFYNNSYAQITGLEVDYGNLTKIGHHYTEKDLFLMALRNGLEDRTYVDWTRSKKNFYLESKDYAATPQSTDEIKPILKNEFFGVGSVLRVIPGIDLCSGGEQTLIGGMKITNETIKFRVKFRPLNIFEDIAYSLYVAFEYNGICTITPGFCDIAMIHIDSYNQIADAQRAPRYRISRFYGKGFWGKVKKFANGVNNFAKKTGIVSKVLSAIPQTKGIAPAIASMGYGYGGSRATRMRGGMVIPPGSFYRTY